MSSCNEQNQHWPSLLIPLWEGENEKEQTDPHQLLLLTPVTHLKLPIELMESEGHPKKRGERKISGAKRQELFMSKESSNISNHVNAENEQIEI